MSRTREVEERARAAISAGADWLETHDWCRGIAARFETDRGLEAEPAMTNVVRRVCADETPAACCALGAVAVGAAEARRGDPAEALHVAWVAANLLTFAVPLGQVARWNDDPIRTKAEVVAGLRRAAATPLPVEP